MAGPNTSGREPVVSLDIADIAVPGVIVEVDPDMADELGAFHEDALTDADAWESNIDL